MTKKWFGIKSEDGSMLIEGLIALALLLIIVTSMVPIFTLTSKSTSNNKMQTIAYNAATAEIERVKSLDYDDVGLVNGSPAGVLTRDADKTIEGLAFHVVTNVKWVDDSTDGLATDGTDPDGRDYKAVKVTYSWDGVFGHKDLTLNTIIARESEESAILGGNIIVTVRDPQGNPIEDAVVQITAGPGLSNPVTAYTDEHGEVIFYSLAVSVSANDYTLQASKTGLVGQPKLNPLPSTVVLGSTTNVSFTLDMPGRLIVHLVDTDTVEITTSSKITLQSGDMNATDYTSASGGPFEVDNLYPGTYQITPFADSYETTAAASAEISAGQLTVVTIPLNRAPQQLATFIVHDSSDDPISGAHIDLLDNVTGGTSSGTTTETGTYTFQLPEHNFNLTVTATGFVDREESITVSSSGDNTFDIEMQTVPPAPSTGSILVRTQKLSNHYGDPRNNVRVRVQRTSPPFSAEQLTGTYAQGETIFNNLDEGWYTVARWKSSTSQWLNSTPVYVNANQTSNCTLTW
jgi:hypothetical protein